MIFFIIQFKERNFKSGYNRKIIPVTIKIASPTNRSGDYRVANTEVQLNKDSDPQVPISDKAPEGYIWHHHEDETIMTLVQKAINREFPHSRLGRVLGVQLIDVPKGEEYDRIINKKIEN